MPLFLERSKVTVAEEAAWQWRGKVLIQKLQQFRFASYPGGEEEKIRQRVCGRKYHIFNHIVTSFFFWPVLINVTVALDLLLYCMSRKTTEHDFFTIQRRRSASLSSVCCLFLCRLSLASCTIKILKPHTLQTIYRNETCIRKGFLCLNPLGILFPLNDIPSKLHSGNGSVSIFNVSSGVV